MKKVLVVSNNCFSSTRNNGKTLYSFFKNVDEKHIAQLFFKEESPDIIEKYNYFKITDKDILVKIFNKLGLKKKQKEDISLKKIENTKNKSEILRLAREILWKTKTWKTSELINWLDEFKPEVIFFCAGDSCFAYDIVNFIQEKYKVKVIVYITDDYILPRKCLNIFWWIRRNIIFFKMKKIIKISKEFFIISPKMEEKYQIIFNKKGNLLLNLPEKILSKKIIKNYDFNNLIVVYMGGFHYGRDLILLKIAEVIEDICMKQKINITFQIYSTQKLDKEIENKIIRLKKTKFCGSLTKQEVENKLQEDIILLHVESFKRKFIEKTILSFSTKISEYLMSKNIILGVGPKEIASINFLYDPVCCITDFNNLEKELEKFFKELPQRSEYLRKYFEVKNEKLQNELLKSKELLKEYIYSK